MKRNLIISVISGIWIVSLLSLGLSSCSNSEPTLNAPVPTGSFTYNLLTPTSFAAPQNLQLISSYQNGIAAYWTVTGIGNYKGDSVKVTIQFAGTYEVKLVIGGPGGISDTIRQNVTIAHDNPFAIDPAVLSALTGTDSKVWVFDQYNLYTAKVKAAINKDIRGHMGLGPMGNYDQSWWGAGPDEKSYANTLASVGHGWKMYDWKLNFSMAGGLKLKITTAGEGYGRRQLADKGGFTPTWTHDEDVAFNYDGGDYTFSLSPGTPYSVLTLSGNAFMGYYAGSQDYKIIYLDQDVMALATDNTLEGQTWIFIYIREDLNKEPPSITADQVTFTMTQGSNAFTYDYSVKVENPNNVKFTTAIDFGDGATTSVLSGSHEYVVPAGTYIARCVLTVGNKTITKEIPVVIATDNPSYSIDENMIGGKSWKWRPSAQGAGCIMTNQAGDQNWWPIDANATGSQAAYDDVLTFYAGGRAVLDNHGDSYMNESTASLFPDGDPNGSFVTKNYVPATDATWEFVDIDGVTYLKLTNVFPMYATSPDQMNGALYKVVLVTPNLMHITLDVGWGAWQYYLVPAE